MTSGVDVVDDDDVVDDVDEGDDDGHADEDVDDEDFVTVVVESFVAPIHSHSEQSSVITQVPQQSPPS